MCHSTIITATSQKTLGDMCKSSITSWHSLSLNLSHTRRESFSPHLNIASGFMKTVKGGAAEERNNGNNNNHFGRGKSHSTQEKNSVSQTSPALIILSKEILRILKKEKEAHNMNVNCLMQTSSYFFLNLHDCIQSPKPQQPSTPFEHGLQKKENI